MKKQKWWSQNILFMTELFGKKYFWMEDVDGCIYLAKAVRNSVSVDLDGDVKYVDQWEPELL